VCHKIWKTEHRGDACRKTDDNREGDVSTKGEKRESGKKKEKSKEEQDTIAGRGEVGWEKIYEDKFTGSALEGVKGGVSGTQGT